MEDAVVVNLGTAEAINKRLDDIGEQLAMIQASLQLHARPSNPKSNWLPMAAAADALHFSSAVALRKAIDRGRIPMKYVRDTSPADALRRKLLVDVEGYTSHLRHK
jgi:hypothetical protein